MGLATLVIAIDFTAFSVALPSIERDLRASLATVQWVINAYAVVFGVVIVTGGRLADMLGRRRVFLIGAGIFAAFSLAGGLAPDPITLIACRAVMGAGGALMWPALMGMTYDLLPESRAGLAGGLILGSAGFGNAVGPLLGGLLTSEFSWRWIALLALSPLGLLAFALVERKAGTSALLPPDVIGNPAFTPACIAVLLLSAVFFSMLLYLPQFMVRDLGWSAVAAGAGLLPMMITFAVASLVAGSLYGRLGARVTATSGAACLTIGIFALSFLQTRSGFGWLVPGMVITGAGVGQFYSSISTAAITALDPARASLAGGVVYMCQVGGGSVGLAVNTAIVVAAGPSVAGLVSGIQHAFLVDAAAGLLGTAVTVTRVGTRPTPHDEGAGRRLGHHRLVHNRDA